MNRRKTADVLLSTAAAAERLGVVEGTLRKWRHLNTGPASFRVGSRVKYRESDLDAWLAAAEKATKRGDAA